MTSACARQRILSHIGVKLHLLLCWKLVMCHNPPFPSPKFVIIFSKGCRTGTVIIHPNPNVQDLKLTNKLLLLRHLMPKRRVIAINIAKSFQLRCFIFFSSQYKIGSESWNATSWRSKKTRCVHNCFRAFSFYELKSNLFPLQRLERMQKQSD